MSFLYGSYKECLVEPTRMVLWRLELTLLNMSFPTMVAMVGKTRAPHRILVADTWSARGLDSAGIRGTGQPIPGEIHSVCLKHSVVMVIIICCRWRLQLTHDCWIFSTSATTATTESSQDVAEQWGSDLGRCCWGSAICWSTSSTDAGRNPPNGSSSRGSAWREWWAGRWAETKGRPAPWHPDPLYDPPPGEQTRLSDCS